MIEADFKYVIYRWMLENLIYFITFKAKSSCQECLQGQEYDEDHDCREITRGFNNRFYLMYYFNESVGIIWDILHIPSVTRDLKQFIQIHLLSQGYITAINEINTVQNIVKTSETDSAVIWIFNELWTHHPDSVDVLVIRNNTQATVNQQDNAGEHQGTAVDQQETDATQEM